VAVTTNPLLAKSLRPNQPPVTLAEHSLDVAACVGLLFGSPGNPTSLGLAWCRFFQLENHETFLFNLTLACLFHDLGKATSGFQKALVRQGLQIFRHEHLSAFLLLLDPVYNWLHTNPQVHFPGILAAVAGHHLKADERKTYPGPYVFGQELLSWQGYPGITIPLNHPDCSQILAQIAGLLSTSPPQDLPESVNWSPADIRQLNDKFIWQSMMYKRAHLGRKTDLSQEQRLMMALKAAVIICDALGSAMPRLSGNVYESKLTWAQQFAEESFKRLPLTPEWIETYILTPRIQAMEVKEGQPFTPHDFQLQIRLQPARTLLLSGCGSGKTFAALYWIQAQLKHFQARRVIFLYPTRATATEGFRDYVSNAGEVASLMHGTALFDLEGMFSNPEDETDDAKPFSKPDERLFALGYWDKQVISATTDSFLAFMANSYSAICLLPLLADSMLVIDEVHAFDSAMFKALQEFLRHFDIPVLCMTASLPPARKAVLEKDLQLHCFPESPETFPKLARQMNYPRYAVARIEAEQAIERVLAAYKKGQRVLWVVNQVDRCQRITRQLREQLAASQVFCYHSRFKLSDRQQIHERVISEFKSKPQGHGLILVTTQVCEMSLDLDADLLVTDLAPVTSLIQRMGRCCRRSAHWETGDYGEVLVCEPENERPYQPDELAESRQFVEYLLGQKSHISQQMMSKYLEAMDAGLHGLPTAWTAFVNGGLYSPPASDSPFRDTTDFTVDVVLSDDLEVYCKLQKKKDPKSDGYIVPVPRYLAQYNQRLTRGLMEAPSSHYSPEYGFQKDEVTSYVY
jgi:CRISPR-associated endonuclease/helicase Cas3